MRLDKYLAEASIGTRKAVRDYIKDGKVTVNESTISEPAAEINEKRDVIRYLGDEVIHTGKVYYMFHKPKGCITARKDACEITVLDYFKEEERKGLFPVGRLDKDTEGLLLFTNDGELEHSLMHPDKHIEKTYFFWAYGDLNEDDIKCLETGVEIGKAEPVAKSVKLLVESKGTYQEYRTNPELLSGAAIKRKSDEQPVVSGYITISEGRKHQVKRMLKAVGCYVVYLKRVSIGNLMLDETLEKGQYRKLTECELYRLF